ncbi:MAG: NUDIX domain-containing protein [Bacillota bacterium]
MNNLEEKTISTQTIYQGKTVTLRVDKVSLPDGGESIREVVEHRGAVAIVPINDRGEILMVRQYRYSVGKVTFEIPAGTLEKGEEPLQCAKRELAEEVGMRAKSWEEVFSFYTSPGFCNERIYLFIARELEHGRQPGDADEFIEVETVNPSRLKEMIVAKEIDDGKTLIGLLAAIK